MDHDNTAIALAIAQHLMNGAARAIDVVNRARLENRAVSKTELLSLASEDDIERATEQAAIAQAISQGR
ncbi:MAG: hypothetical protein IT532_00235 [Burkholderiales bacterium]|nr:hypothetical protein [Burkholderiales bacterium]